MDLNLTEITTIKLDYSLTLEIHVYRTLSKESLCLTLDFLQHSCSCKSFGELSELKCLTFKKLDKARAKWNVANCWQIILISNH